MNKSINVTTISNILIHKLFRGNSAEDGKAWWRRSVIYLIALAVRKYPYLHKMDNLLIDFKKKTVQYEQDQKNFHILQTRSGSAQKYILDDDNLKRFSEIVATQQSHEESVDEKIESLQAQMNEFKMSIDEKLEAFQTSVDEIKTLLLQLLSARRI